MINAPLKFNVCGASPCRICLHRNTEGGYLNVRLDLAIQSVTLALRVLFCIIIHLDGE